MKEVLLAIVLMGTIVFLTMPSCVHDPIGVEPIDTMEMDTMIPPDTSMLCDPDSIYFRKDVLPIMLSSCGIGLCHDAATKAANVEITSYSTLIASNIVDPFDPEGSKMYERMTEMDLARVMPPDPQGPISDTNIAVVRKWIEQGALNLDCPDDTTCTINEPVSFAQDVFPIIDKFCVGCHSGDPPRGGIFLRNHAEVADQAVNGTLLDAINRVMGASPMPVGMDKLKQCDIDRIRLWTEDGAPDN